MALILNGTDGLSDVDGTAATPAIRGTDTNTGIFFPAADTIAFSEGGTESARFDSAGNVGIGTSSPNTRVQSTVGSNGSGVVNALRLQNVGTSAGDGAKIIFTAGTSTDGAGIASTGVALDSADLRFYAGGNTERMRITSGGTLIVNDTATSSFFDGRVSSFSATLPGVSTKTSGGSAMPSLTAWNTATSGDNLIQQFATETSPVARGSIDFNRGAGQLRYNTTSDATLKNLIGDSDKQKSVGILSSTRIREYAWKDDAEQKPQVGVIAQELYETYKGAVSVGGEVEKTNEDGNVTTQYNPWTVDKTAFTFHLIAGWQEHQKLIQELKAELDTVKAELATLKAQP